jgi:Glutathione S-transferase, N-terminal domain
MVLRRFGAEPFIVSIERSRRRCSSHLHEKNSGRVEKRCFAGNPILVLLERSVADMVRAARTGVTPHANRAGGTIESKGGPIDERRQISRDASRPSMCPTRSMTWNRNWASLVTLNCIPSTRVPMLRHDDFTLNETSAIVGYLEDTFPKPPLQNGIRDRAPGDRKGGSRFDLSCSAMEAA